MLRLALGQDPRLPRRAGPYRVAATWFLRHWSDGVIRRRPTKQEIEQVQHDIPGVTVDVITDEGDRLSELIAKYERCAAALPFEID